MKNLSHKRILIVDDETSIREILRDEFTAMGAQVDEATGGHMAVEMAKAVQYDAIISDARMPDGDGLLLAQAVHEKYGSRTKFFFCSGLSKDELTGLEPYAIVDIFSKPFDFDLITSTVALSLRNG